VRRIAPAFLPFVRPRFDIKSMLYIAAISMVDIRAGGLDQVAPQVNVGD
jgi:hypothetical protein